MRKSSRNPHNSRRKRPNRQLVISLTVYALILLIYFIILAVSYAKVLVGS
jgi:hypothetical protein